MPSTLADLDVFGQEEDDGLKLDKDWLADNAIEHDIMTVRFVKASKEEDKDFWVLLVRLHHLHEGTLRGNYGMSDNPTRHARFQGALENEKFPILNVILVKTRAGKYNRFDLRPAPEK